MSENGPSNKCPLTAMNSDETLKIAEESTQRPTTRPLVDKKGTPIKHEAQLDNENDKEGVTYGSFARTFDCISKWWKEKDSGTMAMEQDKCLDKKEKELPSKSRSLFQELFWRGSDTSEANVHGASGPHMTKPKGTKCHLVFCHCLSGPQFSLITFVRTHPNLVVPVVQSHKFLSFPW